MNPAASRPPERLERWLGRLLGAARWREDALGDLAEVYAAGVAAGRRRAAWCAYLVAAARLAAFAAPRRLAGAARARIVGRRRRPRLRPRARQPLQETPMAQWMFDLRLALRSLARRPALTLVMVLTLSIGLGVNAAIFGVLDALVLRPFAFPEVDRLVHVRETTPEEDFGRSNLAPATFLDLRRETGAIVEALVGYDFWNATLMGSDGAEKLSGYHVSTEFFDALRVRPVLGRTFLAEDGAGAGSRVVVLGHDFWQRRFAGDPEILGRILTLDGEAHTVIGVAPRGVSVPEGSQLWSPLVFTPEAAAIRSQRYLGALARLRTGVSFAAAQEAFATMGRRLAAAHPATQAGRSLRTETLSVALRDAGSAPVLGLLQAAAAFVLLIGCVNLANLILARGAERQRELAVLDALGAGRRRLLRLLLSEGALLGLGAALLSVPIAALGLRLMREAMPADIRRFIAGWERLGIDPRILGITAALSLLAVLAVSVWPALRASRASRAGSGLRDGGRGRTAGAGSQAGRSALVVSEIALGLALLVAAAISVRGARAMLDGPLGFRSDRLLTFRLSLPEQRFADPAARYALARRAEEQLATLPGVEAVSVANFFPGTGNNQSLPIAVEGEPEPDPAAQRLADFRAVEPSYFDLLGFAPLAGRLLAASDSAETAQVAVVSRAMAERFWPDRDPLGRRFRAGDATAPWVTVVGVVPDHVHHWFNRRNYPTYFRPLAQAPRYSFTFGLRAQGQPEALIGDARRALRDVDSSLPIFDARSLRESIDNSTIGLQYVGAILSIFAGIGLVLAASGIYAVMAYRVSLRTPEIGVRLALGASARDVWTMTMGQALRLTALGLALGLALSALVARALDGALQGVARADAALLAAGVAVFVLASVSAAWLPTRRALGIEPAEILRRD